MKSHVEGAHELGVFRGRFLAAVDMLPAFQERIEKGPVKIGGRHLRQVHLGGGLACKATDVMKAGPGGRRRNERLVVSIDHPRIRLTTQG